MNSYTFYNRLSNLQCFGRDAKNVPEALYYPMDYNEEQIR